MEIVTEGGLYEYFCNMLYLPTWGVRRTWNQEGEID